MSVTQTYSRRATALRLVRTCTAGLAAGIAVVGITMLEPHDATAQSQQSLESELPQFYSFSGPEKVTKKKMDTARVADSDWKKAALKAWSNGDYATAHAIFKKALADGNITAAWHLGNMYRLGRGVKRDQVKALEYYQLVRIRLQTEALTRKQRDLVADSMVHVANAYRTGIQSAAISADPNRAYGLYFAALNMHHPGADHGLGMMFLEGTGVRKNLSRAQQYFYGAAVRGYVPSMTALGDISFSDGASSANRITGAAWYLIALEINTDPQNEALIKQRLDAMLKSLPPQEVDLALEQKLRWLDRYTPQPAIRSVSD